ncbi:competence damage-inducible protein A [Streptomyces violarus]|uniref:Nicotinamide-nucleotide amidase n=1 Tax=Streptomyces violarus TaxID=67380 RepID=A0A7W4ZNL8_9ACTN|nr:MULTISPECIES: CinA family protein [Streptomyces]MBB3075651.1 nicotinamide-nucleotide amidase [Streptomyces violarus]WRT98235.1 CinA family protein [Streptomyces sp. CGMCC 4.1772]GHD04663.1 competence damage-inducible protein A [Streptomyces violarus]
MSSTATDVVRLLTVKDGMLPVAQTLTDGFVAAEVTSVSRASQAFRGSVTASATGPEHELLGVDATAPTANGAVDAQVAGRMAVGLRRAIGADRGIVTTGVSGAGPQDGQAVGTVFVAVDGPFGVDSGSAGGGKVKALRLNGDREEIRRESVRSVLALLLKELAGEQTGNERAQDTERNGGF